MEANRKRAQSVMTQKQFDILHAINPFGATRQEIKACIDKNVMHREIATLIKRGFVKVVGKKSYSNIYELTEKGAKAL